MSNSLLITVCWPPNHYVPHWPHVSIVEVFVRYKMEDDMRLAQIAVSRQVEVSRLTNMNTIFKYLLHRTVRPEKFTQIILNSPMHSFSYGEVDSVFPGTLWI